MQFLQRSAPLAISRVIKPLSGRQPRRSASHDPHTSHSTTGGPTPGTESFGRGFYLLLAALPTAYIVFSLSRGDQSNSFISSLINRYKLSRQSLAERNALHTRMVEQAGQDRNLFLNTRMPNHYELRNPETLTSSSPINVQAGHGTANMDALIAHYQEKNLKEEETKLALMKEGQLKVQRFERESPERKAAMSTAVAEAGKGG